MARIRSIKPEFCTSEQVGQCCPTARLLFVSLWMFCDDHGNHPASVMRAKAECFPYDSFSGEQMQTWIDELIAVGLLVEYQGDDGKNYWHVTGWGHQKIDKPNQKYPRFRGEVAERSPNGRRMVAERSPNGRRMVAERSPEDVDVDVDVDLDTTPPTPPSSAEEVGNDALRVISRWRELHPRSHPSQRARDQIRQRLRDGYRVVDILAALDAAPQSKSLRSIVRDSDALDAMIRAAKEQEQKRTPSFEQFRSSLLRQYRASGKKAPSEEEIRRQAIQRGISAA